MYSQPTDDVLILIAEIEQLTNTTHDTIYGNLYNGWGWNIYRNQIKLLTWQAIENETKITSNEFDLAEPNSISDLVARIATLNKSRYFG